MAKVRMKDATLEILSVDGVWVKISGVSSFLIVGKLHDDCPHDDIVFTRIESGNKIVHIVCRDCDKVGMIEFPEVKQHENG